MVAEVKSTVNRVIEKERQVNLSGEEEYSVAVNRRHSEDSAGIINNQKSFKEGIGTMNKGWLYRVSQRFGPLFEMVISQESSFISIHNLNTAITFQPSTSILKFNILSAPLIFYHILKPA